MRNKFFFLISILLVSALLTGCAGAAYAQTTTPAVQSAEEAKVTRTITVSGTGKTILTPDIAYINIGVHTENKSAKEAVSANNTDSQKVIDALKAAGIAAKDIQTTNFSIYPQQQYDTSGKPTGEIIYMVDNTVYVTIRDLTKIGDILDAAVQSGANSIGGIEFDVADKTGALSAARQAAVKDAQSKAQELAGAAGVSLGAIQTISESSSGGPPPILYSKVPSPAVAEAAAVPVSPGQLTISVDVSIVYEIQ